MRWDGGIEGGSEVSLFYDPMLAKLIVHAATRDMAIARMHRALLELTIDGVETSREFHLRVLEHPDFRSGNISIQWLEQRLGELATPRAPAAAIEAAAIAAALLAERDRASRWSGGHGGAGAASEPPAAADAWRRAALAEGLRS